MKVYALVGKSGTGKSYQAMNLCRDLDIEAIIDDGLFIYGNGILAGKSAKRQGTVIGALKPLCFPRKSIEIRCWKSFARWRPIASW